MSEVKFSKEQLAYLDDLKAQMAEEAEKKLNLKLKQRESNIVTIGAEVVKTETVLGKPIIDKETQRQRIDKDGVPQTYPDKYKADITFKGGSLTIDINQEVFEMLQPTNTYLCEGYYGSVRKFGTDVMEPIFTKFTQI